jgi:hypothetical protein
LPIWHQKSGSDPLDYFLQEENEEQGGHQEWNNKLFALEESNINDIE